MSNKDPNNNTIIFNSGLLNQNQIQNQNKESNKENQTQSPLNQLFNKNRVYLLFSKDEKLLKSIKEDIESNLIAVKNPSSLYNYLTTLYNFKQYIILNNFESRTIIDSFRLAKYVILKKNFKLFNQGDKTDSFYLVLSGLIGFSLKSTSLKPNITKEINSIKSGTYFGEYGFIFRINRTVSAYAKENTLLLKFDKKCFKEYYYNNIVGSENICKKFVVNHINTMKKLGTNAFNQNYREIKKIYCLQGSPVFLSGEKADSFYLIFKGSCCLKKGLNNLIIKDEGDLIGIESLFKDKYETTIYTNSEDVVLLKFVIKAFNNKIINQFKKEFNKYYQNQKYMIELWEENYKNYKNKYKLNFFNLLQNYKTNKINNSRIMNKIKLSEISGDMNKIKEENYSSLRKINYKFRPSKISLKLNRSESMKFFKPKLNIKPNMIQDIKNAYIFDKISNSQNHDISNKINKNKNNGNKNLKFFAQRINSAKTKYRLKFKKNKKNYSYFAEEEEKNIIPAYKKINLDNHFSFQNFKLKKKRINSAIYKYKTNINDNKRAKDKININFNKKYISYEKFEKTMKILTDNLFKSEKKEKEKKQNISNIIENEKSHNMNNNNMPIMIIRNYSMFNDSQKFF